MLKKILSLSLLVLLAAPVNFAYLLRDEDEEAKLAELKQHAEEFLRETSSMALNLRSPANRVNFSIKSADILWDLDEREARMIFGSSVEDIKNLFGQIDMETNQLDNSRNNGWTNRTQANELRNKTNQAFSLRTALVSSLSNHDPEWALRFVEETSQMLTNPTLKKRIERDNKRAESQIARKFAEKDVSKALEMGREKLSKSVNSEVVNLLSQIYAKDKTKGAEFGEDVLQKIKSAKFSNGYTWLIVRLFQNGLNAEANEIPLFDKAEMSGLAELLASYVTNSTSRYRTLSTKVMEGLDKYAPNSAAEVKRTFEQRKAARNSTRNTNRNPTVRPNSSTTKKMWENRANFQKDLAASINRLGDKELTSEDRQNVIREAKSKIMSVDDNIFRFNSLVGLAVRAANSGETDLAKEILNEAEYYIDQDPKQRSDFTHNRNLANAYASVDANRAFIILENMVYRLNGVINAYVSYMEFTGNGRIVENDELVMNSRNRQFTNYFKFSTETLKKLAESDYARLRSLSDKFERPEIRIEARLLIAEALLKVGNQKTSDRNVKTMIIDRIRSN